MFQEQINQQANQTQSSEVSDSASNSGDQTADSSSSDIQPESQNGRLIQRASVSVAGGGAGEPLLSEWQREFECSAVLAWFKND